MEDGAPPVRPIREVPGALERSEEIRGRLRAGIPAVFLDYDGTLTAIVDEPGRARLPRSTRDALQRLRALCPVAVVSGRDLEDVRRMVRVEGIHYAGSHGFDVLTPDGERHQRGTEYLPALARAEGELTPLIRRIDGARLERKGFALAVHYRGVDDPGGEERVEEAVNRVVNEIPGVRRSGGKKVVEVRPDVEWDKGRAVRSILDDLDRANGGRIPVYVGDDVTDEDAFQAVGGDGITVVVRGEDEDRETSAAYALDDPRAVRDFLELVIEAVEGAGTGTDEREG